MSALLQTFRERGLPPSAGPDLCQPRRGGEPLRTLAVEKFANSEQSLVSREPLTYMRISVWVMEMH